MEITLWIAAAVVCLGLCAYGISVGIRRAKERREHGAHTPA
jgi:hypothetical protein